MRVHSQVWMRGDTNTSIRPLLADQSVLIELNHGAPRLHVSSVYLVGQIKVQGYTELHLTDCIIAPTGSGVPITGAALVVDDGMVILAQTTLRGHLAGAISVAAAGHLTLIACTVSGNRAQSGGAMLVTGGVVVAIDTNLTNNSATTSGGAIQVLSRPTAFLVCTRRSSEPLLILYAGRQR